MPPQKRLGAFLTISLLLCFVGFVTWLDWVGLFAYAFGSAGIVVGQSMFSVIVIGLLIALGAVLRSAESPRYERWIVALSIVWLLVLPYKQSTSNHMFTRRLAKFAASLLFALTLALPLAPAAQAQAASTQGYWCWDNYWGWYPCSWGI